MNCCGMLLFYLFIYLKVNAYSQFWTDHYRVTLPVLQNRGTQDINANL